MSAPVVEAGPGKISRPAGPDTIGIRSHLAILYILLGTFALISLLSFLHGSRSEDQLESSLKENLALLTKLPELRGGIRRIDLLTELYFKSGEAHWLERRGTAIAEMRRCYGEIKALSIAAPARNQLADFDRALTIFLDHQQGAIQGGRSKDARPLDRREIDLLSTERDALLEIISSFGDKAALDLQATESRTQLVSHRLYLARLALDFLIAGLLAFYLSYYILRPLHAVETIATAWRPGKPWPAQTLHSIPEIRNVITHFTQMAERLNSEFGKAEEISEFKTNLISIVSHEFGNALQVIKSAIYLIEEKLPPGWRQENDQIFDMILSNIEGLFQAVHNLLNMARLHAGKLAVNLTTTDAEEILRSTFKRLELLCEKKALRVSLDIPEGLQPVRADKAALALVVSNLLSNAIKYTPVNGRIVLGILRESPRPDTYRIYVQDTGIGVAEEDRIKILGGNYRSESGKKMTLKGYGVGLSLAELIIEAHGSAIEIEGSPGKGSRFSFLLPIQK